jgi:excinuclease UvrABC nuclease subunit
LRAAQIAETHLPLFFSRSTTEKRRLLISVASEAVPCLMMVLKTQKKPYSAQFGRYPAHSAKSRFK